MIFSYCSVAVIAKRPDTKGKSSIFQQDMRWIATLTMFTRNDENQAIHLKMIALSQIRHISVINC